MDLQALPKVELHRHLDCSMRFSTLKELAPQVGIQLPKTEAATREMFLITEPMSDLGAVLKKFMHAQAVLASEEILTRLTYEVCEDAAKEGIRILELRYAPTFILQNHKSLSFESIHRAILKGLAMAKDLPLCVGLIGIVQRTLPLPEAQRVIDFVIDHKDSFIGLDLADNEAEFGCRPFGSGFEKAKKAGLKITVHAGEAKYPEAPRAVWDAIDYLGADRIGHGLQIHSVQKVVDYVRTKKIPLELCPTSNRLTNAVPSIAAHPIRKLLEAGVQVTINSDDPGIFDLDLVHEYRVLQQELGFTQAEFDRCNDFAAAASFIPLESKQKYWPRPIAATTP